MEINLVYFYQIFDVTVFLSLSFSVSNMQWGSNVSKEKLGSL